MITATFTRVSGKFSDDGLLVVIPVTKTRVLQTPTIEEMVMVDRIVSVDGWKMVGIPQGVNEY